MDQLPFPFIRISNPWDHDLNKADQALLERAFRVFRHVKCSNYELLNMLYQFAFSCGNIILDNINEHTLKDLLAGTATSLATQMVRPDLYNEDNGVVDIDRLISGDIILSDFYDIPLFYCDGKLFFVDKETGFREADLMFERQQSVFGLAVLRPSVAMRYIRTHTDMNAPKDVLTPEQQAVISTAKAYWHRGIYLRYADTRYMAEGEALQGEFRWSVKKNPPEACHRRNVAYTNCAAFVYDCYYFGLDFSLPDEMFTTERMANLSEGNGTQVYLYERAPGSVQSDEEQERIEEEFMATLEPADIMVIRREDGSGHALLYIGDGNMLHSIGQVYDYENARERNRFAIQHGKVRDYFFSPDLNPRGDVFTQATQLLILRPLQVFQGAVPEAGRRRAELEGVVVEKYMLTDERYCYATPGDPVYMMTRFVNYNPYPVTLQYSDTIPEGTQSANNHLSTPEVVLDQKFPIFRYHFVFVNQDVPMGSLLYAEPAIVNGVPIPCQPLLIGGRFHHQERHNLWDSFFVKKRMGRTERNMPAAKLMYAIATRMPGLIPEASFAELTTGPEGLLKPYPAGREKPYYQLNPDSPYRSLLLEGLYGGRYVWSAEFEGKRAHRIDPTMVMSGDLILYRWKGQEELAMYVREELGTSDIFVRLGEQFKQNFDGKSNARESLEALLATDFFLILRPVLSRRREEQIFYDWSDEPSIQALRLLDV